jgi:hypothetical protein
MRGTTVEDGRGAVRPPSAWLILSVDSESEGAGRPLQTRTGIGEPVIRSGRRALDGGRFRSARPAQRRLATGPAKPSVLKKGREVMGSSELGSRPSPSPAAENPVARGESDRAHRNDGAARPPGATPDKEEVPPGHPARVSVVARRRVYVGSRAPDHRRRPEWPPGEARRGCEGQRPPAPLALRHGE